MIESIFDKVKQELLPPDDERMLKIALSANPSQEELDDFLSGWDIEKAGSHRALMLSYCMKAHPELKFPGYTGPRLNGLLRYYQFQNLRLMSEFHKIGSALLAEGIDFLTFKGGALRHLRPELPRIMGDIDILVQEDRFADAIRMVRKMGYVCNVDRHSVDLHYKGSEQGILDIHRYYYMNTGKERTINNSLFYRSERREIFGVKCLLPSNEDLLFISLVNMVRNIADYNSSEGIPYTLFDTKYLIQSVDSFNWQIVYENGLATGTLTHLRFAAHFINNIFPDLIPEQLFSTFSTDKELDNLCYVIAFNRYYMHPRQIRSHELSVEAVMKDKKLIKDFLKVRPLYTFLKLFRTNPTAARLLLRNYDY